MAYEYRRFGKSIVRREAGSTDDWEEVPDDDKEAEVEVRLAERQREENIARLERGEFGFGAEIIRGGRPDEP